MSKHHVRSGFLFWKGTICCCRPSGHRRAKQLVSVQVPPNLATSPSRHGSRQLVTLLQYFLHVSRDPPSWHQDVDRSAEAQCCCRLFMLPKAVLILHFKAPPPSILKRRCHWGGLCFVSGTCSRCFDSRSALFWLLMHDSVKQMFDFNGTRVCLSSLLLQYLL